MNTYLKKSLAASNALYLHLDSILTEKNRTTFSFLL